MVEKEPIKVSCKRCSHSWIYKGKNIVTPCPKCRTTVRIRKWTPEVNDDYQK